MKQVIFLLALFFTSQVPVAQTGPKRVLARYEAASWKTRILDESTQVRAAAPPTAAASRVELKAIREAMSNLDAKDLALIKYWDAGAPSYRWNQIIPKMMNQKPEILLRFPAAWINLAIYDATILAWREKLKYKRVRPANLDPSLKPLVNAPLTYSYPCEHSVTAAAAATVIAYFLPEKGDSVLRLAKAAAQSRIDAGVQFPSDVTAGWKLGEQVAAQVIEAAKKDGSDKEWKGQMNTDPKKWTGPVALGLKAAGMTPLIIRSADQFRPAPPPDFEAEMKEMKDFKQTFRSRLLAYLWAASGPELYSERASQKMFETRMMDDAPAAARVYTIMNTAFHDVGIDPSGHAAGAGATCAVLEYFFPADKEEFQQMAKDCADSRFYAGIHFKSDNEVALKMGKELGKYVVETWMKE